MVAWDDICRMEGERANQPEGQEDHQNLLGGHGNEHDDSGGLKVTLGVSHTFGDFYNRN